MISRQAVAAIAAILSLAIAAAANPKIVGSVLRSQAATVRGISLRAGSTIFSGDTIQVGPHGSARIALPDGAEVQVFENSEVRLTKTSVSIQLTIDRGQAWAGGEMDVLNQVLPNPGGNGALVQNAKPDNDDKDDDCDVSPFRRHHRHHRDCHDD